MLAKMVNIDKLLWFKKFPFGILCKLKYKKDIGCNRFQDSKKNPGLVAGHDLRCQIYFHSYVWLLNINQSEQIMPASEGEYKSLCPWRAHRLGQETNEKKYHNISQNILRETANAGGVQMDETADSSYGSWEKIYWRVFLWI